MGDAVTGAPERVGAALRWAVAALAAAGCESPALDAELLLGGVLGWPRERVLAHPQARLDPAAQQAFARLVERRQRREPVAYLLERRAFWDMDLRVRPGVLIPRPETEHLVEQALAWALGQGGRAWAGRVADVGVGSGAVALALARELPQCWLVGVDASAVALEVAQENVRRHGMAGRVCLVQGDLLTPLRGPLDCVVANPPYVAADERLPAEVAEWEPAEALVAGPTGIEALSHIVAEAPSWLRRPGALVVELAPHQAEPVARLAAQAGFEEVEVRPDLAGRPRMVVARFGPR